MFTTQTAGGEFALPDGRAWELVSPPNKNGAAIEAINREGWVIQASADGSAITYVAKGPDVANPPGNSNLTQILSARDSGGWSSQDIATPHSAATPVSVGQGEEYRLFSEDLSLGIVEPFGPATPLSPEASERTIYRRNDADGSYLPLVTAANVPPGTKFGGNPKNLTGDISFLGATPDLSHLVLGGEDLTSTQTTEEGLYEWAEGRLQLVSVLPESEGGMPASYPELGQEGLVRHAISSDSSDDGSRIIWSEQGGERNVYMR